MVYRYTDLKDRVNAGIKGKFGILLNGRETINNAVREVMSNVDMRSTKRVEKLAPRLVNGTWIYEAPFDLKDGKIVDLKNRLDPQQDPKEWVLTTLEELQSRGRHDQFALRDASGIKDIIFKRDFQEYTAPFEFGSGTWSALADATAVSQTGTFNIGNANLTAAGITNSTLDPIDFIRFQDGVVKLTVTIPNITGIEAFVVNIGTDPSNYMTALVDDLDLIAGDNDLQFDLADATLVGNPDMSDIRYMAFIMVKDTSKINQTGFAFKDISFAGTTVFDIHYYTKSGWLSDTGTYKDDSDLDGDFLNADVDEYNIFINKAIELAADEVDEVNASAKAERRFNELVETYRGKNPSETKNLIMEYARF